MPKVSDEYVQARREHIMDAARRCFARNGFHATTMPDILSEAQLSSGAVYRYFASKDDIIVAIGQENLDALATAFREIARRDAAAGAAAILDSALRFVRRHNSRDHLGAMALLVWSESLRNDSLKRALRSTFTQIEQVVADALRADDRGPAMQIRPEDIAALMVSIIAGYLLEVVVLPPAASSSVPKTAVALLRAWS